MKKELETYVGRNSVVAEMYHGERADILKALSRIVGEKGIVYGIDSLNPFEGSRSMKELTKYLNIKLLRATLPNTPKEINNLDAVVIREFLSSLDRKEGNDNVCLKPNKEVNTAIGSSIKNSGYLMLVLNDSEKDYVNFYKETIENNFPCKFDNVYSSKNMLVFKKGERK